MSTSSIHPHGHSRLARAGLALARWLDSHAAARTESTQDQRIDWLRIVPFIALHLAAAAVVLVGWSPIAVAVAAGLYALRVFALTGFYHRYFAHRSFRTSRAVQLVFAVIGTTAVQGGPLWWASHHRHHHAFSDRDEDAHSPDRHGFLWSHMGWFLTRASLAVRTERIRDLMRYPELRMLDRFDRLVPLALAGGLYAVGKWLAASSPELGTSGAQLVVWGMVISTLAVYHVTFSINSLAHRLGRRPYATGDSSRNNAGLALLAFGEGWHNNHHHYPRAARQGFVWWEVDLTYYLLRLMAALGLVWDLQPVPARVLAERHGARPVRETTS